MSLIISRRPVARALSRMVAGATTVLLLAGSLPAVANAAPADQLEPAILSVANEPTPTSAGSTLSTAAEALATTVEDYAEVVAPCTHDFTDMAPADTFYDAVTWMACQGITNGYSDHSFGRNKSITRGEVASFLYRHSDEKHIAGRVRDYTDVSPSSKHFQAISWMKEKGLTKGYWDGSFGLNKPISRGELASFMYRYAADEGYKAPTTSPFKDVSRSETHYGPITWMRATGLVKGYVDSTFRSTRAVTRGESAKYFYAVETSMNGKPAPPAVKPKPAPKPAPAPKPTPKPTPAPKPTPPLPTGPLVYTTVSTSIYASNSYSSKKLYGLPAQTSVMKLGTKGKMTKVRRGQYVGWVNSYFLTTQKRGTTAKPYARPANYAQRASNNIAPYCYDVPVTTMSGVGGRAGFSRYNYGGDNMVVTEYIKLGTAWDSQHPGSIAIQLHECAHILQYRAYKYDYAALDKAMERVYPGGSSSGVEHMADCMTDVLGGKRSGKNYWIGYGGTCTAAQYSAARKVISGQRV